MKRTWKQISSLILAVCMVLTMLPTSVFAANIGMGQIYFGKNSSGLPILWYIVATDANDNSITLWTPASMGARPYDSSTHDSWSGSDICTWLNGAFFNDAFTSAEQAAIADYGSTEDPDSIVIRQKIVLPSVNEMGTGNSEGVWKIDQNSRASVDNWWLRTPGASDNVAVYVNSNGEVLVDGDNVSNTHDICPALKLDVSSILFGTSAADGKSRSIGSIAKVVAPSGAMKATIVDSSITTPSLTLAAESNGTNAIKFAYSSAKTGANQYLSCALLRSNTIEYYGKLANCASTSSGEFTFPTSGVGKGTYEMEIFCEQVNADSFSDFASAPVGTMILKVDADGKGTVSGTGFSSDDSASPVLSAGIANRTSDTEGTIGFTTNEDGTAFYTVVEKDASAPDKNTVAAGTSIGSVSGTVISKSVTLTSGAKDIYVVVKDAAGNISDPLNIEAAAYVPPDIIAPVLSAGSANRTSDTEGTIGFITDEDGTAFYTVVEKDASAPDKNTVAAGTSIGSVSGTVINKSVTLTSGAKDIYLVVKDAAGNISDPLNIEAAAYVPPDIIAPVLSAGSANRASDTEGTIGFTTDEDGTAFYTVVEKDASAPDKRTVAAGTSIGSVSGTVTNLSVALTVGAKDIYVVVKDADGNISEPLKIQAATYVPPLIFVANEAQLKEALASTVSSDIRVQTSITLRDAAEVKANHTLIVTNTLKTQQNGSINVGSHTLTVKGGGTLSSETRTYNLFETKFGQDPHGTLNLENITVNLKNSDDHNAGGISNLTINMNTGAAIHVNSVRGLMPDDLTVNSGAMLNVTTSPGTSAVALGGVMHINGGTVNIISGVIEAYSNVKLKYTSGTLTGSNGGSISVSYRCKIEGMADKFKDRAVLFSNSSEVTVDVENNLPSASGLTVGEYLWDGTCFAKTSQIIWGETTANGVANTSDTTELTLSFANNPRALTADHFKVTGATKGILSGSGMIRTLAISNITVGEGEEVTVEITAPDGYSVTTPSKTVAVHKAAIVTDTTAPILSSGSLDRTSDTEATIYFTSDEAGTAYYSVVDKDTSAPDKNVVAAGTSLGSVSGTVADKAITLTTGAKDIYVVVKDASYNISEPLKIAAAAYASPLETLVNKLTGIGLNASASGNTVTVTGTKVVTDTLSLKIPTGVKVLWNASLTGAADASLILLNGDGIFELAGGEIVNTGTGGALSSWDTSLVISSGTASSASNDATVKTYHTGEDAPTITMTDGNVISTSDDLSSCAISAGGKTVITGGTVTAQDGNQVFLNNTVVVYRSDLLAKIDSKSISASIAVSPSKTYALPTETDGLTATGYPALVGNVTAQWNYSNSGWTGIQVDYTYSGGGSDIWRVSYPAVQVVSGRHSLTYNANGGIGAATPVSTVYKGQSYTVSTNVFTRTNYIFTGWNTEADGTGTPYAEGATLTGETGSDDIVLYAQWSPAVSETTEPSVSLTHLNLVKNSTGTFTVNLGQNGNDATSATVISENEGIVTVSPSVVTVSGTAITVTGITAGRTSITVNFNGGSYTGGSKIIEISVAEPPATSYTVTFDLAGGNRTGGGELTQDIAQGSAATAPTVTRSGYTFNGWDKSFSNITGTMTVTALWTYNSGSGGNTNSGGSSGGGSISSEPTPTVQPEKKPDQPVSAEVAVTAKADKTGLSTVAVSEESITNTIAKAQTEAKTEGTTDNGIGVALNVKMPKGSDSLNLTLTANSLQSLINANVQNLEIKGAPVSLGIDLKALQEIQKQNTGNVSISIAPATGLSKEAKALIGSRPVYSITISTVKDGKTTNVTSLGTGTATLSIPYTPGKKEAMGYLFGVYVDGKGKTTRIEGSAYDANSKSIIFNSNHFSVYGVGYTAPSEKFKDISSHWAKESIDYVVGRGLLSGTTDTAFSPNSIMTRGMLVTALGRLAGVDVKAYATNSFTDVKLGSAFQPYIEWAYKKGIIQGTGNGKFEPDRAITREEIAVIFSNYAKAAGYKLPVTREAATYVDAEHIGSVYKTAVTAMQQAGIMMGGTDNKFNPTASATRAEVSTMLYRYIKLTIDPATAQGWALNDAGQYLHYKDGKALTGTQTINNVKYYFNTDGTLKTGWVQDGSNWRYYSGNKAAVGWLNISDKRCYFTTDGLMVSGKWLQIE